MPHQCANSRRTLPIHHTNAMCVNNQHDKPHTATVTRHMRKLCAKLVAGLLQGCKLEGIHPVYTPSAQVMPSPALVPCHSVRHKALLHVAPCLSTHSIAGPAMAHMCCHTRATHACTSSVAHHSLASSHGGSTPRTWPHRRACTVHALMWCCKTAQQPVQAPQASRCNSNSSPRIHTQLTCRA